MEEQAPDRAPRLYVYKLTTDNGGAPCVHRGLLSLAICKPDIRRTAQKDDWIFGFGGRNLGGRLIYVARVSKRVEKGCYYVDDAYEGRPDRIYRREGERFEWRKQAKYHRGGAELKRDLGTPDRYANAITLLSDDFRYWGRNGTCDHRRQFPAVARLLDGLRRKFRVNLSDEEMRSLCDLRAFEWRRYPKKKVLGRPCQGDRRRPCNRAEGRVGSGKAENPGRSS